MSAFAAIFRRDGGPASSASLAAIAGALAHRGADGSDRLVRGPLAAVHVHDWVTPEERGERQPLDAGERVLVFDGRLDNRPELLAALAGADLSRPPSPASSDAQLALAAHAAWGDDFCRRLVGPFALAIFDLERRRALLARDALGDRTLFYAEVGSRLLVASEESALLADPEVPAALDEYRLAHYFALRVPDDGSTFFSGVRELRPGRTLRFDAASVSEEIFWSPPVAAPRRAGDAELAEEFRRLLSTAVECRLRSESTPAVLMSGGLDSTSVAALGAEAPLPESRRLRAVSWVFSDTRLDERAFIRPVVERLGLEWLRVEGDGLGPSLAGGGFAANPNSPEESPYRALKAAAYAAAAAAGSKALLTGGSADALYTGFESWFVDLWRQGGRLAALGELALDVVRNGPRAALRRCGLGRGLRHGAAADGSRLPWLTAAARELLAPSTLDSGAARALAAAGPRPARAISLEVTYAARHGVDLRHPYRDRRLVEFMLGLPGDQLYRRGVFKPIARRALAGRLPDGVLARTRPTSLSPLFEAAVRGTEPSNARELLEAPDALWPKYVRREFVATALERSPGSAGDVALWNCLAIELWRRRFDRR